MASYAVTANLINCNGTYPENFEGSTENFSCSITANNGYIFLFTGAPLRLKYKYVSDSSSEYKNLTRSTDKKTATLSNYNVGEDINNITLTCWAYKEKYSIEETLTNCTSDITEISTNEDTTITLTADENATFEAAPTLVYTYSDGSTEKETFKRSTDNTTATLTTNTNLTAIDSPDALTSIVMTATATKATTDIPITKTLTNCTSDIPDTITSGSTITWTITANSNYKFYNTPSLVKVIDGKKYNFSFTIASDNNSATITTSFDDTVSSIIVEGSAISQTFTVEKNISYCVGEIPDTITVGDTISITLTADENYNFVTIPTISYTFRDEITETINFDVEIKNTVATLANFSLPSDDLLKANSKIIISAVATPVTTYKDKYGTVFIYNVTVDNLTSFAENRFYDSEGNSIDVGNYVSSLQRVYCNLGETLASNFIIANYTIANNIVQIPLDDIIITECGTITINGINENAVDYEGKIEIYLPFIGVETLDIGNIINNKLHLYYKTSLINGESVAFLEVNDIIMYTWNCNISQKIAYLTNENNKSLNTFEYNNSFLHDFTPFIILSSYDSTNNEKYFNANVRDYVYNMVGYFEMDEIENFDTSNILKDEYEEILKLLKEGVFYE